MIGTISLIIVLIVYLPVIYLIAKTRKKKGPKYLLIALAILFFPILYFIIWFNFPYYHLVPFEGKVLDADTKQPISGGAVLAIYYGEGATIQGASTYAVDAQETLTDANGEFKIPEVKEWFGNHPRSPVKANLIIFKPGYGAFPRHQGATAVDENKSWPPPEKHIAYLLPKLKTREERKENVIFMPAYTLPQYLRTINEERKSIGIRTISVPNEAKFK